jgi:PhzF family phenazine biosynthesis protein
MLQLPIYQVDSFTTQPFTGNPAGVVPNASGLTPQQMQAIAREMNNSETAFVIPGDSWVDDVVVRFFTPTTEVPVCGHATIAAHFVMAMEGAPLGTRDQRSGAGLMRIDSEDEAGVLRIWMHQRPASFQSPLGEDHARRALAALGLESCEVHDTLPLQVVSTGHSKVIIPVKSRASIARLKPDLAALSDLSREIGCNGYYPFTMDSPEPGMLTHARMFAPAIGIPEDPVTGNAVGCLGAYLLHHRLVERDASGQFTFTAGQGTEVGRPGAVTVTTSQPHIRSAIHVKIAGRAVVAFKGMVALP